MKKEDHVHIDGRVGGGLEFRPPKILKLSIVTIVLSQVLNNNLVPDCVRSNLNSKFSGGAQIPLVGTHAYTCVSVLSCNTIILLPSCPTPLNSKSCMKPWTAKSLKYLCLILSSVLHPTNG